jgi:drug/metabolite transporter (DMT)-like permease
MHERHVMSAPSTPERQMTLNDWGLLLLLSLLWGCTFLFVGIGVKEIPPLTLVLLRVGIAAAILFVIARARGIELPQTWVAWQPYIGLAILNNVIPFTLIAWGQQHIASGLASVLNASTPVFSLLFARAFAGDPIAGNKLGGVIIGIVGVAVLLGPDLSTLGLGLSTLGMLAVLGAAASYGMTAVWARRVRGEAPLKLATAQLMASTVMMTVLAAWGDKFWNLPMPSTPAILAVLGSATISTAVAYLIFFRIVTTAGPQNANLVTLLIPPSAILLGALVLGERLTPQQIAGAIVIGLGLLVIDGRLFARAKRDTRSL